MKFTKKQRREIYLEAAYFLSEINDLFICLALHKAVGKKFLPHDLTTYYSRRFPEFALFDPKTFGSFWFGHPYFSCTRTENTNSRITCLLLCAEMCKE